MPTFQKSIRNATKFSLITDHYRKRPRRESFTWKTGKKFLFHRHQLHSQHTQLTDQIELMNAACEILPADTSYLWFDLFIVYRNNIIWRHRYDMRSFYYFWRKIKPTKEKHAEHGLVGEMMRFSNVCRETANVHILWLIACCIGNCH